MACGTPVVSADCPSGPVEILEGGRHGKLVLPGDHQALARAIDEILVNAPDCQKAKNRAAEFSLEKITGEYIQLFGSLLTGGRGSA
jgi:glycosyltransferase involved in cell wall biosynthesis